MTQYKPTDEDVQRFWSKVDTSEKENTCWNWIARDMNRGYGRIQIGGRNGKKWQAHRFSWFLYTGIDPGKLCVLHHCDTPSCVNPRHLFLGSQRDNVKDMYEKGRDNPSKGSAHFRAKLSENDVREIRNRYAENTISQSQLADIFHVSTMTINHIIRYITWKHIE